MSTKKRKFAFTRRTLKKHLTHHENKKSFSQRKKSLPTNQSDCFPVGQEKREGPVSKGQSFLFSTCRKYEASFIGQTLVERRYLYLLCWEETIINWLSVVDQLVCLWSIKCSQQTLRECLSWFVSGRKTFINHQHFRSFPPSPSYFPPVCPGCVHKQDNLFHFSFSFSFFWPMVI